MKRYFALLALILAAVVAAGFLWSAPSGVQLTEISGHPFKKLLLLNPVATGATEKVEVYVIFQKGEADMTGPEGLLHYVEHLTWLSTVGTTNGQFVRDSNAWTDKTNVGYWLSGPKENLGQYVATLMRVFDPIKLDQAFALQERSIVEREYDLHFKSNPDFEVDEQLGRFLYLNDGLKRSVIGRPEGISNFSLAEAEAMRKVTHIPENAVLLVVGNVSADDLKSVMPSTFETVVDRQSQRRFLPAPSDQSKFQFPDLALAPKLAWRRVVELDSAVPPSLLHLRCALLRELLISDVPGGLAKPLRFDAFVARNFDVQIDAIGDRHVELRFYANPDSNVSLAELQKVFEAELSKSAAEGIPENSFQRVLGRIKKSVPEDTDAVAINEWSKQGALAQISLGLTPLSPSQFRGLMAELNLASANSLLRRIASGGRTAIAFIGKEEVAK